MMAMFRGMDIIIRSDIYRKMNTKDFFFLRKLYFAKGLQVNQVLLGFKFSGPSLMVHLHSFLASAFHY